MCSGRDIPATIGNMRTVDWQSLGINFVLVFSPNAFKGAPHTHIATLTEAHPDPAGDAKIIKAVADAFPMVTSVRVREALETVGAVVTNLVLAIRGASAVTLISAILVLGGALAAGHRHRVYDAVILKTLGATRARLLGAYALEYLMIGFATAIFGVAAGSVAAWLIVTRLMTLGFIWQAGSAAGRGRSGADRHRRAGARRHAGGAEPEAGDGAAEFMTICSRWAAMSGFVPYPGKGLFPRPAGVYFVCKCSAPSDIQPRMEACRECVSFPHISLGRTPA